MPRPDPAHAPGQSSMLSASPGGSDSDSLTSRRDADASDPRWELLLRSTRRAFTPTQPAMPWHVVLGAALSGALTIAVLTLVGHAADAPLLIAAFGSSCVLVFLLPDAPLSRPVNVVGGHMISALCGVAAQAFLPTEWWSLGLVVGAAMAAMAMLRIIHPPAGATPIAVLLTNAGWDYLVAPVLAGSLTLTACAVTYRALLHFLRRRD